MQNRFSRLSALALAAGVMACTGHGSSAAKQPSPKVEDPGYRSVLAHTDIHGKAIAAAPASATIVVVFASWCGPCRHELGMLRQLASEKPGLRVIGVNAYEDWDDISNQTKLEKFLGTEHPWLTVVRADDAILSALGGVPKVPSLFLFDSAGAQVRAFRRAERRPPNKAELENALAQVMK